VDGSDWLRVEGAARFVSRRQQPGWDGHAGTMVRGLREEVKGATPAYIFALTNVQQPYIFAKANI
jgi:hypothetical protein